MVNKKVNHYLIYWVHFCALISPPTSATSSKTQVQPQVDPLVQSQMCFYVDF